MNKFLKYFIIFLVALLAIFIAIMFIAPKQLKLDVTETIDAPPNLVFNLVNDLEQWQNWSPWAELDPNAVNNYTEKTYGEGAKWSWKGNDEVGEGSQTIEESVKGESIKMALEFSGWEGISYANWKFEKDGNKTKVNWGFDGAETALPFRIFNLLMKGALTKSYKDGLSNLKDLAETRFKEKVYNGFKINEVDISEKYYIHNRQKVEFKNIQQYYQQSVGALFSKLIGENIEMDGKPSGLFFNWEEKTQTTDMAAGIPIKEAVNIKNANLATIPAGKALTIDYYGDYASTESAHAAMDLYLDDYGLLVDYPIIEEYMTDPADEKDPKKWLTKITYYYSEN